MNKESPEVTNNKKDQLCIISNYYIILAVYTFATLFAIIFRILMFSNTSVDMSFYLIPWYNDAQEHGMRWFEDLTSNYTPLYNYFLIFIAKLGIPAMIGIKTLSCIFDFLMAVYVSKFAAMNFEKDSVMPAIAYTVTLCLPTAALNSAYWGQCDCIFTTLIIMSLYYIINEKETPAMILYAFSFTLKLQAVFFMPFLLLLFVRKKLRARQFLWIPAVYFTTAIPALIAGYNFYDLVTLYFGQSEMYNAYMTLYFPNIWACLHFLREPQLSGAGIFAAVMIIGAVYCKLSVDARLRLTKRTLVFLAAFTLYFIPFVLPCMHERYWYPAEIMMLILVFYDKKIALPVTFAMQFTMAHWYLKALDEIPQQALPLFVPITSVIMFMLYYMLKKQMSNTGEDEKEITLFKEKTKAKTGEAA